MKRMAQSLLVVWSMLALIVSGALIAPRPSAAPAHAAQIGPAQVNTTITVTTSQDFNTSGTETCADVPAEECSLRRAVVEARSATKPVLIAFNLPTSDPGYDSGAQVWTIDFSDAGVGSALRRLNGDIIIDGTTQSANQPNDTRAPAEGPGIFIRGSVGSTNFESIVADGDNNEFRGLGLQSLALQLNGNNALVEDIWSGLEVSGETIFFPFDDPQRENNATVRDASGSSGTIIRNNVFTGARSVPIVIEGDNATVTGNSVGTRADGTIPEVAANRQCKANARYNNWFGGGAGIKIGGDDGEVSNNVIAGLLAASESLASTPPLALDVTGTNNTIQGNAIGLDANGAEAWVCGTGIALTGGGHNVLDNTVYSAPGAIGVFGTAAALEGGGITIQNNILRDTFEGIFFGQTVPTRYANFNPAKVTSIAGTTITGTQGDDGVTGGGTTFSSACGNCTIQVFADNNDEYVEALELLAETTADADGNWTATLSRALNTGEGVRTASTTAEFNQIENLAAETTTKLSVLYGPDGPLPIEPRPVDDTPIEPPAFADLQPTPSFLEPRPVPALPTVQYATVITVTSTSDPDISKSNSCYSDAGILSPQEPCTLRRALTEASSQEISRPVQIRFDLPENESSGDYWKIELPDQSGDSTLFRIEGGQVTIDGTTQPGGRENAPKIVINGYNPLTFPGDANIVRGLALQGVPIVMTGSDNFVEDNWLGLNDDGQTIFFRDDDPTTVNEARIRMQSTGTFNNVIRGNVVSGSRTQAIGVDGGDSWVVGNYIGTRADGTVPPPNPDIVCATSPASGNWFGGFGIQLTGSGHQVGGPNPEDRNYLAGLAIASNDPESSPPDAIRINASDTLILNNAIGRDTSDTDVGVCGEGVNISGSYNRIQENIIVNAGDNPIRLNTDLEEGNGNWYDANIIDNGVGAIVFGPNVPDDLKIFNPAKVTSINGTTVSGTSGDPGIRPGLPPIDSSCPFCLVQVFRDDTDDTTEALELLAETTADADGNWTAELPAALGDGEGIRTTSTARDYNVIDNYEIGTTTKLSELYTAGGVVEVEIDGPTSGEISETYVFTATVVQPENPDLPITYEWDAIDDGAPIFSETTDQVTSVFSATWDTERVFTVTVEASNIGGSSVAQHTITISATGPGENEVGAEGGAVRVAPDVTLTFPAGAVSETTTIAYEETTEATPPTEAIKQFTLTAEDSGGTVPGTNIPFTMTVTFSPEDLAEIDLNTLALQCWNGTAWETVPDAVTVLDASSVGVELDEFGQCVLVQTIDVVDGDNRLYLPYISR